VSIFRVNPADKEEQTTHSQKYTKMPKRHEEVAKENSLFIWNCVKQDTALKQ
jgi:hypothetical protein